MNATLQTKGLAVNNRTGKAVPCIMDFIATSDQPVRMDEVVAAKRTNGIPSTSDSTTIGYGGLPIGVRQQKWQVRG